MAEAKTAKLFKHGRCQAVRLPKEFRLPGTEVRIRRHGSGVLLEPIETDLCPWFAKLDAYLDEAAGQVPGPFALKLDVQGYESHVLDGARRHLAATAVILLEMQLSPLYEGGATFDVVCSRLIGDGYRCISMSPGFIDQASFEVLEVDGLFVR